jgi:hypothetical protein
MDRPATGRDPDPRFRSVILSVSSFQIVALPAGRRCGRAVWHQPEYIYPVPISSSADHAAAASTIRGPTSIFKTGRLPAPFEDVPKLGGPTSHTDFVESQSYGFERHTDSPMITIGISTSHAALSITIEDASLRIGPLITVPVRSAGLSWPLGISTRCPSYSQHGRDSLAGV